MPTATLFRLLAGAAVLAATIITACTADRDASTPGVPVVQAARQTATRPGERPLRIALAPTLVPEQGVPVYQHMMDYLEGKIGRDIDLITGLSYDIINAMLNDRAIDAAFVNGLPYVLLRDQPGDDVELLAAPVMKSARYQGKPVYYADLIVRKDSDIRSIHDLRGRTYVYNEEISNSGYNLPRARLLELGYTHGFFGNVQRSGSHEDSIRMVLEGHADASFVTSLVLEYEIVHDPGLADRVRVVESLGPTGTSPLIARSNLPEGLRKELQHQFLVMHDDPVGRTILDQALIQRFVHVDDASYDDVRALKNAADAAGFQHLK